MSQYGVNMRIVTLGQNVTVGKNVTMWGLVDVLLIGANVIVGRIVTKWYQMDAFYVRSKCHTNMGHKIFHY
jgi:hypothetical protein